MRYPTDKQVDDLVEQLQRTDWERLKRQLKAASRRDRELAVVDGYPASTSGGGRGGAELTSVEAAAEALAYPERPLTDPVHDQVQRAFRFFLDADTNLRAMHKALSNLERAGGLDTDRFLCEGYQLIGVDRTADHFGDVGGKLPTKRRLSDEVVKFVSKYGRMPTGEEMRSYNAGGRWRVRATA